MPSTSLAGRAVVVFGGSGALGRAVVDRLVDDGASVLVADVHVGTDARARVAHTVVDVLDEHSVDAAFGSVGDDLWGVVNVIGGWAWSGPLASIDIEGLREQLELNLVSATIITKYALGRLVPAARGRIVHVSSRTATEPGEGAFAYSVAKLGVLRLVASAAAEVRNLGLTVNAILPSVIDTPANRSSMPDADFATWPAPSEIAEVIAFLMSDGSGLVSGAEVPVFGRA